MSEEVLEQQRLRWQCRRGMRELDVLLERHLSMRYAHDETVDQQRFRTLLEAQDPQLQTWLLKGVDHPDPHYRPLIERIRRLSDLPASRLRHAETRAGEQRDD